MNDKYIINIGRQLGSGGRLIGRQLAKDLNFAYYDKELISLASQESGLNKEFFEKADEKNNFNFFKNFLGLQFSKNYLGNDTLFKIQSDIIKDLANLKSSVFVGRCADYILREQPLSLNIFITADIEDRAKRTAERKKISEAEALEYNKKTDRQRKEYYNFYSNRGWGRASSYHLCINSSVLGLEKTTNYILSFIKEKFNI